MTNQQIIFNEAIKLMEDGIIGSTGKTMEIEYEDGSKHTINEPEPIHTFAGWKNMGYQVIRGQKAIASFPIWKHCPAGQKVDPKTGETTDVNEKMFMVTAYFFKRDQVERIQVTKGVV